MTHSQTLLYMQFLANAFMGISLGVILPYTIIITAKSLRYMQSFSARMFGRLAALWLVSLSSPPLFEVVNTWFGPWNHEIVSTYIGMTAALFTVSFAICCYLNRHSLQTLLPKEDFLIEQEKRQRLLTKMLVCDNVMPLARYETRHGIIVSANNRAQEEMGYTLLQFHKMAPGQLVHRDDRVRVLQNVLECSNLPYECKLVTASGRIIFAEIRTIVDPGDSDLHISFVTDVTPYVKERERRQQEYLANRNARARETAAENVLTEIAEQSSIML